MERDFHVHTTVSWCAAGEMTPAAIAAAAARAGIGEIGLSDHLWLDPSRGSRPAVGRLVALRDGLARQGGPLTLRLGAEADCAPGLGAAGGAGLAALDFVVAADHFSDLRFGLAPWPVSPESFAQRLVDGLRTAVESPHAAIVGHPWHVPFRVTVRTPWLSEAYRLALRLAGPALAEAARRGVKIELNAKALGPRQGPRLLPFFRLAREAGCAFAFASDAHRLGEIGRHRTLADYARAAGISFA